MDRSSCQELKRFIFYLFIYLSFFVCPRDIDRWIEIADEREIDLFFFFMSLSFTIMSPMCSAVRRSACHGVIKEGDLDNIAFVCL